MPSAQAIRHLPLFNCSCGCFGCGGFYLDVTLTPTAVVWANVPLLGEGRPSPGHLFLFSWENIREVAGELLTAIYTAQAQHPGNELRYGATGIEMIERLPYYLKQYEALCDNATAE